jgi:phospholipid/cholesterol/gamma-HCH transport system substrate-binding protein
MKTLLRENAGEAVLGLLVVILALWFVASAWTRTGGGDKAGAVTVTAMFPNASGVNVGTDVRVSGLKIGSVVAETLDPKTFQVAVKIALDPSIKLPSDSSAIVTSEGLLGSTYVGFTPGGSEIPLKTGDVVTDTQGSMDLMALIGQFINKGGSGAGGSPAAAPSPAKAP